jgi:hypothetical protein
VNARALMAAAVAVTLLAGCTKSTTHADATAPTEFTSATIDSFVADLAKAGVAVYPTGSTTPMVKVDTPGPLALSQDQAGSADQIAESGMVVHDQQPMRHTHTIVGFTAQRFSACTEDMTFPGWSGGAHACQ